MALRRGFFWTLIGTALQVLCTLGVQVILARALKVDGRGAFAVCWAYMGLIQVVAMLGCDAAVTYHLAGARLTVSQAVGVCGYLSTGGMILAVGLGAAVSCLPLEYFQKAEWDQFVLAGVAAGTWLLYIYAVAILRGMMAYRRMNLAMVLNPIVTALLSLLLCVVFPFGVEGALWAGIVAPILVAVWVVFNLRKQICLSEAVAAYAKLGPVLNYGSRAIMTYLAQAMNIQSGVLVAGFFLPQAEIGFFSIAITLVAKIWIVPDAFYQIVMPYLAQGDADSGASLCRPFRLILWAVTGASLAFAVLCWPMVYLAFGEEYLPLVPVCYWLLIGVIFRSASKVVTAYFLAADRPGLNSILKLFGLILNIVLLIVLVPEYGLVGTAVGTSLSYVFETLLMMVVFYRVGRIASWGRLIPQPRDLLEIKDLAVSLIFRSKWADNRSV